MKQVNVNLSDEDAALLDEWAQDFSVEIGTVNRSIVVRRLIQQEQRRRHPYEVVSVSELPHPEDAESVPLVSVREK